MHCDCSFDQVGKRIRLLSAQKLLVDSPDHVVDSGVRHREADVQLTGALGNGNYADIVTSDDREQAAQDTARALHSGAKHGDDRDVAMDRDWIQDPVLKFRAEKPLDRMNHALGIGFAQD
jgi:hypothetical protein